MAYPYNTYNNLGAYGYGGYNPMLAGYGAGWAGYRGVNSTVADTLRRSQLLLAGLPVTTPTVAPTVLPVPLTTASVLRRS